MENEARLIEAARDGREEAFLKLLRLHQGRVRAYLWRFLRAPDVVDDLAQETFLKAFKSLGSYKGDSAFAHWLLGIARHAALMHLRDERLRKTREADSLRRAVAEWRMAACETEGGTHDQEVAALRDCMKGLQQHGAEMISARYLQRRTCRDIARQLGRKESAVRMTLLRLRQGLKECIRTRLAGAEVQS